MPIAQGTLHHKSINSIAILKPSAPSQLSCPRRPHGRLRCLTPLLLVA